MRCSCCGNEFGNGNNCQHCGVDKVTGLANLSGYNGSQGTYQSQNGFQQAPTTTACYSCGEIIPANSQFCPVCGKKLLEKCPKCGNEYPAQYSICNRCGTNREQYLKELREKEEDKKRKEREIAEQKERDSKSSAKSIALGVLSFVPIIVVALLGRNRAISESAFLILFFVVVIPFMIISITLILKGFYKGFY